MALQAGFSPEEIAQAAYQLVGIVIVMGSWSDKWEQWIASFSLLTMHEDPDLVRVREIGAEMARERRDRARTSERREEIYGW